MRLGPVEMQPRDVDRKPRHAILVLGEQRGESGRVERIDRAPVGLGHRGSFGRAGRSRASSIPAVGALPPETARLTPRRARSEEHTSELQSLIRISYAVFCLKKKNQTITTER